jgi:hypothetical protein
MALGADVSMNFSLRGTGLVSVAAGAFYGGRSVHWMDFWLHFIARFRLFGQP